MALFPTPQESCFYLDPNAGLTDGNLWKDSGPHGLHCTPVGYAAPAFGIFTGPSGAKAISFNGANQRGELPLRFYQIANLPSTEITVAVVARHNAPAANDRIFHAYNAARGMMLQMDTPERLDLRCYAATGVNNHPTENTDTPFTGRTRVSVIGMEQARLAGAAWEDRVQRTVVFVGDGNPCAYDVTAVPTVGATGGGGQHFDGDLYCLGIWGRIWSDSEAKAFCDYWMSRC